MKYAYHAIAKEGEAILQQGIKQERQEIARATRTKGFAVAVIADVMRLTVEQVESLLKQLEATDEDHPV